MSFANSYEPYFPFGFRYPTGLAHSETNPDPGIEAVRERMEYLNSLHQKSGIPGHQFAAALALFQKESLSLPDRFWEIVRQEFTDEEVIEIAKSLLPQVQKEPPRLEFPNSVALFDCRFVSTSEWEHIRRYSIGGSEASTVLGKSHFQSPRTLYHEKKTPYKEIKDIGRQHILDYGHDVEDHVVQSFASSIGAVVYPEYRMFAHKDYPFITCNPDGILLFLDGHLALFEAKTAMWLKLADWKEGIPDYYEPQPRQYMEVLNDPRINEGYIGVCAGGLEKDNRLVHYTRDAAKGADQIQQIVHYWNAYIVPGEPPEFSGDPKLDMTAQYRYVEHNTAATAKETIPDDTFPLFERYYSLESEKLALEKEAKEAKKQAEILMDQIKLSLPDGLTIVSAPGEVISYHINVKDTKRESVFMQKLVSKSMDDTEILKQMAETLKEPSLLWTTPKITRIATMN